MYLLMRWGICCGDRKSKICCCVPSWMVTRSPGLNTSHHSIGLTSGDSHLSRTTMLLTTK